MPQFYYILYSTLKYFVQIFITYHFQALHIFLDVSIHTILYIVNRYSVYMYIFHCEVGHLPQEEPLCIHCQYVVLHVIRKKNKISLIGLGGGSLALLFLIYI